MKRRRLVFCAFAALAWVGCAAVAGLDDFEIVPGSSDAAPTTVDGQIRVDGTPRAVDGETPSQDADDEPMVIDAGPCGPCPRSSARAMCLDASCAPTYRVFITHAAFNAVLGGVAGADSSCQNAARAAGLGGTWKAWLAADKSSTPHARFTSDAGLPYRTLDGTEILASGTVLLTADKYVALKSPIDLDENGSAVAQTEVWTGILPTGDESAYTCDGWTTNDGGVLGLVGISAETDGGWTAVYEQFCDRADQHLYCFEQ